ncbi:hypothetical protein DFH06DRAFT_1139960 [Mycena polygramma]|nr:hypothetical protein DFH06DRAFT_1139960 [Mycena polygramma]
MEVFDNWGPEGQPPFLVCDNMNCADIDVVPGVSLPRPSASGLIMIGSLFTGTLAMPSVLLATRFAHAGGRMMFHLIRVWGDEVPRPLIALLSALSPAFCNGLQRNANKVPELEPSQVAAFLWALIQAAGRDVVEIH